MRRGAAWQPRWKWLECEGRVGVNLAQAFMWPQEAEVANPVRLECGSGLPGPHLRPACQQVSSPPLWVPSPMSYAQEETSWALKGSPFRLHRARDWLD